MSCTETWEGNSYLPNPVLFTSDSGTASLVDRTKVIASSFNTQRHNNLEPKFEVN